MENQRLCRACRRSGIDTDARWGFSHTKQWIFGYKLHITSSTGSLIIPLSADFTQADVQDNQRYPAITSSLPNKVRYAAADLGYDDHQLYKFSTDKGFELVCPVQVPRTSKSKWGGTWSDIIICKDYYGNSNNPSVSRKFFSLHVMNLLASKMELKIGP